MPIDPNSGLMILGGAIGSAKLVEKVLGPTAEYVGQGLRDFAEHRRQNVKRIFEKASGFLGESPRAGEAVPPRVLRDVLNDGSYRDDELTATYYGGILASSRSGISRDDRGAAFTGLVGRLTTYQLRGHYILYRTINELYHASQLNFQIGTDRGKSRTFVPIGDYVLSMGMEEGEDLTALVGHVLFGLHREALIEGEFLFGSVDNLKQRYGGADGPGMLFQASAVGIELFLWATGNSRLGINAIGQRQLEFPDLRIPACSNARRVS